MHSGIRMIRKVGGGGIIRDWGTDLCVWDPPKDLDQGESRKSGGVN